MKKLRSRFFSSKQCQHIRRGASQVYERPYVLLRPVDFRPSELRVWSPRRVTRMRGWDATSTAAPSPLAHQCKKKCKPNVC
jgi:hypothetical protein